MFSLHFTLGLSAHAGGEGLGGDGEEGLGGHGEGLGGGGVGGSGIGSGLPSTEPRRAAKIARLKIISQARSIDLLTVAHDGVRGEL